MNTLQNLLTLLQTQSLTALTFVAILWGMQLLNYLVGYRLNILGIYPRHWFGLLGIPCFSFLHVNFNHLFFNSIPLFVLSCFILVHGIYFWEHATLYIILISGSLIWLFGRRAIHIGASSLVMGYFGLLLMEAYRDPSLITILPAIVVFYYFGGLIFDLFPQSEKVSWEGHVFGFIAGLIVAY